MWLIDFIYELLIGLLLSIVGHHRSEQSFNRKTKVYKPLKDFLKKYFHLNLKTKAYSQIRKDNKSLKYRTIQLVIAILVILWIRHSVIEPYKIPSGSMIPSLKIGDHIFVNKLAYGLRLPFIGEVKSWDNPHRGDVVVFVPPLDNGKVYVKRLVGLPGDKIRVDDDKLYINDQFITKTKIDFYPTMDAVTDEKYHPANFTLYEEDLLGIKHYVLQYNERYYLPYKFNLEVTVPEDAYFFMGDNRDNSEDSRVWGFANRYSVRGKAMFVWLSLNWSKMFTPSWIRYSRFGHTIK